MTCSESADVQLETGLAAKQVFDMWNVSGFFSFVGQDVDINLLKFFIITVGNFIMFRCLIDEVSAACDDNGSSHAAA